MRDQQDGRRDAVAPQQADADAGPDRKGWDERNHIPKAERVAAEERIPRECRRAGHREYHQQRRLRSRPQAGDQHGCRTSRAAQQHAVAVQVVAGPPDRPDRLERPPGVRVVRHVESVGHEPLPDRQPALEKKRHARSGGKRRECGNPTGGRRKRQSPAPEGEPGDDQRSDGDRPGLVAGEARGCHRQAGGRPGAGGVGADPSAQQRDRQRGQAEQERLGHGRGLEVENVGIQCHHREARECGCPRARRVQDQSCAGVRHHAERQHGQRDGRRPSPVARVDLNGEQVQDVGQRQPDGADLRPAWRQAVNDPASHHQMGLGVVVAERQAGPGIEPGRRSPKEHGEKPGDPGRAFDAAAMGWWRGIGYTQWTLDTHSSVLPQRMSRQTSLERADGRTGLA